MRWLIMALTALPATAAWAQDPVDVGVVTQSDILVVQKLLYPKRGVTEISGNFGVMPFDAYTITPTLQVGLDFHTSESFSWGAVIGVGYGVKTGTYRELETQYGVAPYAFRYLGSLLAGVAWAPIYAKANIDGAQVVHFDIYLAGRAGATVEQSLIPEGGVPVAPTLSPAIGNRIFLGKGLGLRLELRDDILLQPRKLTENLKLKQNVLLLIGVSALKQRKP